MHSASYHRVTVILLPLCLPRTHATHVHTHGTHMFTHTWANLTLYPRAHPFQGWVNHAFILQPVKAFSCSLLWHLPSTLKSGTDERGVDSMHLRQINRPMNPFLITL